MTISSINSWKSARFFPETYPGECPDSSYLYYSPNTHTITYNPALGYQFFNALGKSEKLDSYLSEFDLPLIGDRFPVLAYGANRNPATIAIKLKNYGYSNSQNKEVIPMLKGILSNADVVASGLHGQGYFFGDLLINSPFVKGSSIEVWLSLLDRDQLRVMNDSEGIKSKMYSLAWIEGIQLVDSNETIKALVYVSNEAVLNINKKPIAYKQVKAQERKIPAMTSLEILEACIEKYGLQHAISKLSGIPIDSNFASELMKYLNGQWWYQFNTKSTPLKGFKEILQLIKKATSVDQSTSGSYSYLKKLNQLISLDESYALDDSFTFKNMVKT